MAQLFTKDFYERFDSMTAEEQDQKIKELRKRAKKPLEKQHSTLKADQKFLDA
jgi:hypothetical protein